MTDVPDQAMGQAAARGGIWGLAAEGSTRASQSVCFFVLAGVLSPAQFGAAAVAFVAVQVANSVTYAGLGAAVQVLGADVRRDRTAVTLALLGGLVGALVLFALAVPLCDLLGTPEATNLVRLISLALPLAQTSEVLSALLDREMRFQTTSLVVIIASVSSAVVGLTLAFSDVGPVALVAQGVVQPGLRLVLVAAARPAALRPALHRAETAELWATGKDLLVGQVFFTASANVDNVVVSSVAGPAALGGYGFVYNLTALPYYLVGLAVGRVALPVYANLRARQASLLSAFQTTLETTAWLAALPLGFLAVAGPHALVVLFGHKWDPVGHALQLLALSGWLRTVETTSGSLLVAVGQQAVMRRVQQLQLVAVVVLLVPLVQLDGPRGAAIAVLVSVAGGTSYSLTRAAHATAAKLLVVGRRLVETALGGAAGGTIGVIVLNVRDDGLGLVLALAAATAVWFAVLAVLRPDTILQGFSSVTGRG